MGIQGTPPQSYPPQEIAGLMIRDYENPLVSLNKAGYLAIVVPLIRPYFALISHGGTHPMGAPVDCP